MRKEPFAVGNYIHVYNRGNRKQEIVRSDQDSWRFMQALRFFNDSSSSQNLLRTLSRSKSDTDQPSSVFEMGWPADWPKKDPLVKILCYCLMPNHYHLLLKEIADGGVSKFMQKLGIGYTNYFNLKYDEVGSLFQGGYKSRTVTDDNYLKYLIVYIQVVNVLELYPGGLEVAYKDINKALKFAEEYPFSSYPDYSGARKSLIIDKDIFGELLPKPSDYKKLVIDVLKGQKCEELGDLKLE